MYRRSNIGQYNQQQRGATGIGSPVIAGKSPLQHATVSNIRGSIERPSVIPTSTIGTGSIAQQPIIRPSVIPAPVGLQQPLVSGATRGSIVSASPVFGVNPPTLRRSFVGQPISNIPSSIGRGVTGNAQFVGGPVTVAGQGISVVPNPSALEVVQRPLAYQTGTNRGNFYEITKPTVEISPNVVTERRVNQIIVIK